MQRKSSKVSFLDQSKRALAAKSPESHTKVQDSTAHGQKNDKKVSSLTQEVLGGFKSLERYHEEQAQNEYGHQNTQEQKKSRYQALRKKNKTAQEE